MVDVNVTGMNEVLKKMNKLPIKIMDNVLVGAIRAGAGVISKEAKSRVSSDNGDLKRSIGAVKRRSKDKNIVKFTVAPRLKKYHGYLAFFHEFGTSKMSAHPFMRPALESKGKETVKKAREYMAKRVNKEISKL